MDQEFSPGCQGKPGSSGGGGTEHQSAGGAEERRRRRRRRKKKKSHMIHSKGKWEQENVLARWL